MAAACLLTLFSLRHFRRAIRYNNIATTEANTIAAIDASATPLFAAIDDAFSPYAFRYGALLICLKKATRCRHGHERAAMPTAPRSPSLFSVAMPLSAAMICAMP